jgi:hypothetical protein
VRTFSTFSADLEALAGWLAESGVTEVAMEARWRPSSGVNGLRAQAR